MIARDVRATSALLRLLSRMHDDGQPALRTRAVSVLGHEAVEVSRAGGEELSAQEARYVRAVLVAHAAEPIE